MEILYMATADCKTRKLEVSRMKLFGNVTEWSPQYQLKHLFDIVFVNVTDKTNEMLPPLKFLQEKNASIVYFCTVYKHEENAIGPSIMLFNTETRLNWGISTSLHFAQTLRQNRLVFYGKCSSDVYKLAFEISATVIDTNAVLQRMANKSQLETREALKLIEKYLESYPLHTTLILINCPITIDNPVWRGQNFMPVCIDDKSADYFIRQYNEWITPPNIPRVISVGVLADNSHQMTNVAASTQFEPTNVAVSTQFVPNYEQPRYIIYMSPRGFWNNHCAVCYLQAHVGFNGRVISLLVKNTNTQVRAITMIKLNTAPSKELIRTAASMAIKYGLLMTYEETYPVTSFDKVESTDYTKLLEGIALAKNTNQYRVSYHIDSYCSTLYEELVTKIPLKSSLELSYDSDGNVIPADNKLQPPFGTVSLWYHIMDNTKKNNSGSVYYDTFINDVKKFYINHMNSIKFRRTGANLDRVRAAFLCNCKSHHLELGVAIYKIHFMVDGAAPLLTYQHSSEQTTMTSGGLPTQFVPNSGVESTPLPKTTNGNLSTQFGTNNSAASTPLSLTTSSDLLAPIGLINNNMSFGLIYDDLLVSSPKTISW
jgi:hypothetical protein